MEFGEFESEIVDPEALLCDTRVGTCLLNLEKYNDLTTDQRRKVLYYVVFKRMYSFDSEHYIDTLSDKSRDRDWGNSTEIVYSLVSSYSSATKVCYCYLANSCDCSTIRSIFNLDSIIFEETDYFVASRLGAGAKENDNEVNTSKMSDFEVENSEINVILVKASNSYFSTSFLFEEETESLFSLADEKSNKDFTKLIPRLVAILCFFIFLIFFDK
jgi:hypothetical protein